jgi:hypothetical protein
MNKYLILSLIIVFALPSLLFAQSENVGINTTTPDNSAALHVTYVTTPKGVLIPRLTTAQRGNIPSPTNALLIFNTTTNQFEYYDAGTTSWVGLSKVTTYTADQFVSTDGSGNLQTFDFSQDLSATTAGVATVTGLQTRAVSSTAPTDGQVLQWDNSASEWVPTTPAGAATYTADQFVSTDGSGNLQTFDFSQDLSATTAGVATVTGLQTRAVSSTAPTDGQVLQWDNSASEWVPTTPSGGGGGGNTLDEAYDQGGNGSGRTINVTDGAVQFTSTNAADESVEMTNSGNGGVLLIENTGTGQSLLVNDEASDTTPFAVDDEGNVGVKTNAPTASLDVEGDFKLGDDGTVLDAIIQETITFRPPAVGANASVVSTQTVTGATVGSSVIVTPDEDFGNGRLVIAFAWVGSADNVSIRFTNVTGTGTVLGSDMDWHITVIK